MTPKPVLKPSPLHPITVEPTGSRVTVTFGGRVVADTDNALTLQEASYPAVQYVPVEDVAADVLQPSEHASYCPFKGEASYYDLRAGESAAEAAAWTYVDPHDAVAEIKGHVAFYPDKVDSVDVHAD
jgi:uncharacterized protein (DUF427 family)